jgi:hypothetical protein
MTEPRTSYAFHCADIPCTTKHLSCLFQSMLYAIRIGASHSIWYRCRRPCLSKPLTTFHGSPFSICHSSYRSTLNVIILALLASSALLHGTMAQRIDFQPPISSNRKQPRTPTPATSIMRSSHAPSLRVCPLVSKQSHSQRSEHQPKRTHHAVLPRLA